MKRWNKKAYPILVGKVTRRQNDNDTIQVWCPFCKRHHIHGWEKGNADSDASHRNAHCDPESPLYDGGYFISVEPKT